MLTLVVNNEQKIEKAETVNTELFDTCRNTCTQFNKELEICSLNLTTDFDNPFTHHMCDYFTEDTNVSSNMFFNDIEDTDDEEVDLLDITIRALAEDNDTDLSNGKYPIEPGIEPLYNSATWYTSENNTYGCWIVNDYKRKFLLADQMSEQHSLTPTRPHNASKRLAPHICWYINTEGQGQYCLLIGGLLSEIPEGVDIYV